MKNLRFGYIRSDFNGWVSWQPRLLCFNTMTYLTFWRFYATWDKKRKGTK